MKTTIFLAKAIGIYLIIIGSIICANPYQFSTYAYNLFYNSSTIFISGFFTLILGILMVLSHNVWEGNWRVIVTLIAWATLLKGAALILYPRYFTQFAYLFSQSTTFAYYLVVVQFFLGLLLLYFAYTRE